MTKISLRPNTIDEVAFRSVVEKNEYRIPEKLQPEDRIIDIGAHIGCFSYLCWQRGARKIEAFEANLENAELAQKNLVSTNVVIHSKAVWRSDNKQGAELYHSGYTKMLPDGPDPVGINTASGNIFASIGQPVTVVALDDIIGDSTVKILKIDCEGSEFPILLTSKRLRQVCCFVGEYHLMDSIPSAAQVEGFEKYTVGTLADLFISHRFRVEFIPYPDARFSNVGNFFAYNLDLN
ncbi:FkbM family methyltransferase [Anabaena minutissima FACHB-250]|nr:FkbM family methyltransferase [Anabaena minutissima FACHB-250]